MTSLKTSLFGSTMASTPPLASFPGWTMPVVAAKRGGRLGDGQFNPPLSLAGASDVLRAQNRAFEAGAAARMIAHGELVGEARGLGKAYGKELFKRQATLIEQAVQNGRTVDGESKLAGNIPAILLCFAAAANEISMVHAVSEAEPSEIGFAHWMAARGEYGAEILRLVEGILEDFAEALGYATVPDEWISDLPDVVMAFVFPGFGENPKDDAWREARCVRFAAILAEVRERRGWGAA